MSALGGTDTYSYPAGIELFRQDSSPTHVYFVETGVVKLKRSEQNGSEFILDLHFPGAVIGSEAAIRLRSHSFSAVTATSCRLSSLSVRRFLSLLSTEFRLTQFIQDSLCANALSPPPSI